MLVDVVVGGDDPAPWRPWARPRGRGRSAGCLCVRGRSRTSAWGSPRGKIQPGRPCRPSESSSDGSASSWAGHRRRQLAPDLPRLGEPRATRSTSAAVTAAAVTRRPRRSWRAFQSAARRGGGILCVCRLLCASRMRQRSAQPNLPAGGKRRVDPGFGGRDRQFSEGGPGRRIGPAFAFAGGALGGRRRLGRRAQRQPQQLGEQGDVLGPHPKAPAAALDGEAAVADQGEGGVVQAPLPDGVPGSGSPPRAPRPSASGRSWRRSSLLISHSTA